MTQPTKTQITAARLKWKLHEKLEPMPETDPREDFTIYDHWKRESYAEGTEVLRRYVPRYNFTGNDADAMKLLNNVDVWNLRCGGLGFACVLSPSHRDRSYMAEGQKICAHAISIAYAAYTGLGSYEIVPGEGDGGEVKN